MHRPNNEKNNPKMDRTLDTRRRGTKEPSDYGRLLNEEMMTAIAVMILEGQIASQENQERTII